MRLVSENKVANTPDAVLVSARGTVGVPRDCEVIRDTHEEENNTTFRSNDHHKNEDKGMKKQMI